MLSSCGDDDTPPAENPEEIIDKVTLTFTPTGGGSTLVFTATDADGEGPADLVADGTISLSSQTTYTLTLGLENTAEGENIAEEVEEEGEEHMFFFSFSTDIFSDPLGNGNVDNRADDVNYNDMDANNEPIGLSTEWTTGSASSSNDFRVVLKHQPDVKNSTSTSSDGETDVDVTWTIDIVDPS